jgi:two-component system, chemotaxis family, response regulator Rcp1
MSNNTVGRPMEILMIEDDLEDAGLTMEALDQVCCRVSLIRDGQEAVEFLRREGKFARVPKPDLILLDMNLPKLSGREILAEIRHDSQFDRVPVVVLTSSETHREVLQDEGLRVEDYMVKPVDFDQFIKVVESLRRYWLADVILPQ